VGSGTLTSSVLSADDEPETGVCFGCPQSASSSALASSTRRAAQGSDLRRGCRGSPNLDQAAHIYPGDATVPLVNGVRSQCCASRATGTVTQERRSVPWSQTYTPPEWGTD
jgi:hypothetical protein